MAAHHYGLLPLPGNQAGLRSSPDLKPGVVNLQLLIDTGFTEFPYGTEWTGSVPAHENLIARQADICILTKFLCPFVDEQQSVCPRVYDIDPGTLVVQEV